MPYSERQRALLQAMGLVPWIDKRALTLSAVPVPAEPVPAVAPSTAQKTGSKKLFLLETVFRGNKAFLHPGSAAASVLVLLEQRDITAGSDLQLPQEQERLLTDMLKAIELGPEHVVRALMADEGTAPVDMNQELSQALTPTIQVVVRLVMSSAKSHGDSEAESRWKLPGSPVAAWNLPHPAQILEQPVLKRRAWNVLKAVKGTLQTPNAV